MSYNRSNEVGNCENCENWKKWKNGKKCRNSKILKKMTKSTHKPEIFSMKAGGFFLYDPVYDHGFSVGWLKSLRSFRFGEQQVSESCNHAISGDYST